jgi:hypothetical protein
MKGKCFHVIYNHYSVHHKPCPRNHTGSAGAFDTKASKNIFISIQNKVVYKNQQNPIMVVGLHWVVSRFLRFQGTMESFHEAFSTACKKKHQHFKNIIIL